VPGGSPWKTAIHVEQGPATQTVAVPALESAGAVAAAVVVAPVAADTGPPMSSRRRLAWIVGGSGAGVLVLGGIFGGLALSEHGSATTLCPVSPCSNSSGVSDNNQAKTFAWVSDFGVGLGLVGLGAAAYLFLTHGDADAPPPAQSAWSHVVPTALPGGGGVSLTGAW
jgi:hypothetical protein